MRAKAFDDGFKLWLSANDTYQWATRPGEYWPCSELSDRRLFVEFDRNGLVDLAIDGKPGDCSGNELDAIVADHIRERLPEGHPCRVFFAESNAHH